MTRCALLALAAIACTDPPTVPPPPVREVPPVARARAAIDSLNVALFAMHRTGATATIEIYADTAGLLFFILRDP